MKELKFRAWNKHDKKMATVTLLGLNQNLGVIDIAAWTTNNGNDYYTSRWLTEETELMQYIGLKDKNGKEIYEGDLLIDDAAPDGEQEIVEVKWDIDRAKFYTASEGTFDGIEFDEVDWKVIGNIYENPELIKEVVK